MAALHHSLHQFLFTPTEKTDRSRLWFWLLLSLAIASICPVLAMQKAFSSEFVVQDDARQHVFWMSRFVDSGLFPGDLIADYFQSVAPWGYSTLYRTFAGLGIAPLLLHKCLPIVLYWITTAYAFGTTLQLLPIPFAGFLTALLLNQSLWMRDDIISATPVAFVYPLFFAFLYYLLKRSLWPCLVTIALQGLFYPQCVFIYSGVLLLQLLKWREGRLRLSSDRREYWFSGLGLAVAFLVMLPYALKSSAFGPVLSGADARSLFTLSETGWSAFFSDRPLDFWLCGKRSGMLPFEWCTANSVFTPEVDNLPPNPLRLFLLPHLWLALSLPFLLKFTQLPLVAQVSRKVRVLPQIILVSVSLFFLAHALIFKLHLPNRYTEHSFRIVAALAAGLALTILLEGLVNWMAQRDDRSRNPAKLAAIGLLAIGLFIYPVLLRFEDVSFPVIQYSTGRHPDLYEFLSQQPKDSVIASIDREVNNIPSFAQRSILVGGRGFVLPYHLGYYQQISQRTIDLMRAQYSPNLAEVQQLIQTYGIDFWLLEERSFRLNYLETNPVFQEFADTTAEIRPRVRRAALERVAESCAAFQTETFTVVDAVCVLSAAE
jgi:hypothetical protein